MNDPFKAKFSNPDLKQLNIFISNINSIVGQSIVETIRNDYLNDEAHHLIIGSLDPIEDNPIPKGVSHTIDNKDIKILTKVLLDSDVIIYDLMKCQLDEVEYAIKVLKLADFTSEKLLICISSVMTWAHSYPIDKTLHSEYFLTEEDRPLRKTFPKYQFLLSIEDQCLQINNIKPNLKSYCLISGIPYGNGEDILFSSFKQAWLLDPFELPVFSDGKNIIPMIHVKDLGEFVFQTIHRTPNQSYIFAIDWAENQDQKAVIQEISKNFGSGIVKPKSTMEAVLDENFEIMRVNLKIKPNDIFETQPLELIEEIPFRWWCKEGFVKNMQKVCDEFIQFRGLRTNKIFISGPPASGKTHYGKQLSKLYNIPHIHIQDVLDGFLKQENTLADEVRAIMKEIKDKMIEEEQAKIEIEKKKNKNKKGWVEPILDTEKINPRIPDNFLYKIFQWRLEQNDCRYRGYVLEGFPRNYEQSVGLFTNDSEKFFLEEAQKEPKKPAKLTEKASIKIDEPEILRKFELQHDLIPESVIILYGSDDFLKERCKSLPANILNGSHYTEEGMFRRLLGWRKMNEENMRNIVSFYRGNDFEIMDLNVEEKKAEEETLKQIQAFIERKGVFKTYNSQDDELENLKRIELEAEKLQSQLISDQKLREAELLKENDLISKQEEIERAKIEALRLAEAGILDVRSQPLRQYLADCVLPYLTDGLIQVYKGNPENPLDFLGDFLLSKSEEIDLEHVQNVLNKKNKEEAIKKDESL